MAFVAAVRASTDPKFGDYQANGCMAAAKAAKSNPRELAAKVAEKVELEPLADRPKVDGPGFLNVRLRDEFVAKALGDLLNDDRLGMLVMTRDREQFARALSRIALDGHRIESVVPADENVDALYEYLIGGES